MAASLVPVSHGEPMVFTQSEATAAQATWVFFLTNTADGTPATGKTISGADFKVSKAGGAFGNATGTVTEISLGWYKMVFAAGDLDTIGALACELSVEAGVDPIHCVHQVTLLDMNIATVPLATGAITTATFAAGAIDAAAIAANALGASELASDAVTEIQSGLATTANVTALSRATHNYTRAMGARTTDGNFTAISAKDASTVIVTVAGTWNGASAQVQVCPDPAATVPVWIASGSALTANGSVTVTGPTMAVRVALSSSGGSTSLTSTAVVAVPRV